MYAKATTVKKSISEEFGIDKADIRVSNANGWLKVSINESTNVDSYDISDFLTKLFGSYYGTYMTDCGQHESEKSNILVNKTSYLFN